MTIDEILKLRDKAVKLDKESMEKYFEYAIKRKLKKDGYNEKIINQLYDIFKQMITIEA